MAALLACTPETGRGLVAMHDGGALKAVRRPDALVRAVARHGEPVGAWVVERQADLSDPAAFEAFEKEPLVYVHSLKALPKGGAWSWAWSWPRGWSAYWEPAVGAVLLALAGLAWWRGRRRG